MHADFGWRQIVKQYFSAQELRTLTQLPEAQQYRAFFDGWARKEAYIKAKEQRLSISLNQFDVSLSPVEPAALLKTQWDPQEVAQWTIHALDLDESYVDAISIQDRNPNVRYWHSTPQRCPPT
jgi:4'-phosphopantetheinyl transferase